MQESCLVALCDTCYGTLPPKPLRACSRVCVWLEGTGEACSFWLWGRCPFWGGVEVGGLRLCSGGGAACVYLAVLRPGCVLQSCGWRSCAYLHRRLAGWAARAEGRPGGHKFDAPPGRKPPQTTSSETGQSPPGLPLTSPVPQEGAAGM